MKTIGAMSHCRADIASLWHPLARHTDPSTADGRHGDGVASGSTETQGNDSFRRMLANKLARMIHTGVLEAGDLLPSERDLCRIFGVARQTLRGSLSILVERLMVEISHGRRSRILGPGGLDLVDCGEALKRLPERPADDVARASLALSVQIAALAARTIGPQELKRLQDLVAQQGRVERDPVCYHVFDFEFHSLVYHSSGNKLLADIAMDFYGHAAPRRRRELALGAMVLRGTGHHASILAALRDRDPQRVTDAMIEHAQEFLQPQQAGLHALDFCR